MHKKKKEETKTKQQGMKEAINSIKRKEKRKRTVYKVEKTNKYSREKTSESAKE